MRGEGGQFPLADQRVYALADDLSGAVEVAALLDAGAGSALVTLRDSAAASFAASDDARNAHDVRVPVQVLDLDLRHSRGERVHAAVTRALGAVTGDTCFVKIDSMLRGSPATMVAATAAVGPAVVCPALPVAERSTIGGRLRIRAGSAGRDGVGLSDPVCPYEASLLDLETVRGPRLRAAIETAVGAGRVPVCDGESDADLDSIVDAAARVPGIRFVGSGGLAAALGRRLRRRPSRTGAQPELTPHAPVLAVVGTTADSARTQTARLSAARSVRLVELAPDAPSPDVERRRVIRAVADGLRDGPVVLRVDRAVPVHGSAAEIARSLGDLVREAVRLQPRTRLFLTGGQTARGVLDALGVRTLTTVMQIGTGAVHCRTEAGRDVVTRPGSLGPDDALVAAVDYLGAGASCERSPFADPAARLGIPTEGRM